MTKRIVLAVGQESKAAAVAMDVMKAQSERTGKNEGSEVSTSPGLEFGNPEQIESIKIRQKFFNSLQRGLNARNDSRVHWGIQDRKHRFTFTCPRCENTVIVHEGGGPDQQCGCTVSYSMEGEKIVATDNHKHGIF